MMYINFYYQALIFIFAIIVDILLGFFVYSNNKKSATNRIFGLFCLVSFLWLISMLAQAVYFRHYLNYDLLLARINVFLSIPHVVIFFLIAKTIPYDFIQLNTRISKFIYGAATILMALAFSPYIFKLAENQQQNLRVVNGPLFPLFAVFVSAFSVMTIYVLIRKTVQSVGLVRRQVGLVMVGCLVALSLLITTLVIPVAVFQNNNFLFLSPIYFVIFLLFTAIAILKYQLFNIKFIAIETLAVLLNSFLFIQIFLSGTVARTVANSVIFLISLMVSWFLIKSNHRELKRHEERATFTALELTNKQLSELDRQKTEFLTIAAHQLRTPVSIINNYISMLQDGDYGRVSKEAKEVLSHMDQSNQWLVRLANEFLNIANIEQGQTKYHFKQHDLRHIVDSVVRELHTKAVRANVRLIWDKSVDSISVTCDEEKVRAVIFNFVDNAIKYGVPENAQALDAAITIVVTSDAGKTFVKVIDEGMGFGSEDQARFFQKFSRGENARSVHVNLSTGLGIYICRKFVEGHGGEVWAHSEGLGKGSEFGFWIPNIRD